MSRPEVYRQIFIDSNGPGPWPCYGCFSPVSPEELLVHHIDRDHLNDEVTNLAPMHKGCHTRLHQTGRELSEEARAMMSAQRKGVPKPPRTKEHSLKIGATKRGVPFSDEHRRKLREARLQQKRLRCAQCEYANIVMNMQWHQRTTGHKGTVLV
jgi:hypothetical protein